MFESLEKKERFQRKEHRLHCHRESKYEFRAFEEASFLLVYRFDCFEDSMQ